MVNDMENYLDFKNCNDYEKLIEPAKKIRDGEIVVFPTETVYGIGTNGLDKAAIERLYKIKKRPLNKPISLLVNNMEMIERVAKNISKEEYAIIKNFMPGPITLILKKSDLVPDILTSNQTTVGVRMPDNDVTLKLIEYANCPIAAPSANVSGEKSEVEINNIISEFKNNVDFYVDSGKSKIGIASTIVKIENGKAIILREGKITKKQIEKVINSVD